MRLQQFVVVAFLLLMLPMMAYSDPRITLSIKLEKESYMLGEPIVAYVNIRNQSVNPMKVITLLDPEYRYAKYYIQPEHGKESLFEPLAFADNEPKPYELRPNESVTKAAKIFFGAEGWSFKKPGKYSIRVAYKGQYSKPIDVHVKEPQTESEKRQADLLLGSDEVGYFFIFEGGDHLKEARDRLEKLSKDYPDSPLAGFANFALGANLSRDFADFSKNELRKADLETASVLLDKSKDQLMKSSTTYYATKAYADLEAVYKKKGLTNKAKDTEKEFIREVAGQLQPDQSISADFKRSLSKELESIKALELLK